jgi:predicted nucleic acid-binding protein
VAPDQAEAHALRGYDAVHLATAQAAECELVVTADRDMLRAASRLGFTTADANG